MVFDVAWSAGGDYIAVGCSRRHVHVFRADDGTPVHTLSGHRAEVTRVGFGGSGRWVVSSGWDRATRVWEIATGEPVIETTGFLAGMARTEEKLLTQVGEYVQAWELIAETGVTVLHGHDPSAIRRGTIDFSPDDRWLASAGADGVRVWDLHGDEPPAHVEVEHSRGALFLPSGEYLIVAGTFGVRRCRVLDAPPFRVGPPEDIGSGVGKVRTAAMSADGRRLAVLDFEARVTVLDPLAPEDRWVLDEKPPVWYVDLDPTGQWVAASGPRPWARIWDLEQNAVRATLHARGHLGGSIEFSPRRDWILFGNMVEFSTWDAVTGERVATVGRGPDDPFYRSKYAVSPGGDVAAVATRLTIELMSLPHGEVLASLESPTDGRPFALTYSRNGRHLAVGYEHGRVEVWDIEEIRRELGALALDWES